MADNKLLLFLKLLKKLSKNAKKKNIFILNFFTNFNAKGGWILFSFYTLSDYAK